MVSEYGHSGFYVVDSIEDIENSIGIGLGMKENPTDWEKLHTDSDLVAHIGIRMISRISTEFTYTNVVGINNLVVRI